MVYGELAPLIKLIISDNTDKKSKTFEKAAKWDDCSDSPSFPKVLGILLFIRVSVKVVIKSWEIELK